MKQRIILSLIIIIGVVSCCYNVPVYAALPSTNTYCIGINDPGGSYPYAIMEFSANPQNIRINSNSISLLSPSAGCYSYKQFFRTFEAALTYWQQNSASMSTSDFKYRYVNTIWTYDNQPCVIVSGSVSASNDSVPNKNYFKSLSDYEESLLPKWYEVMWDTLADYFQNPVPFGWFKNLIDRIFGDDNNGGTISENVTITAPTLAPTPTPIPYSTVVIPKTDIITGDTVYETNYYYVNPSGTPIVTSSPPTNEPSSGGGGGGSTEYVPIGGDPFSIPAVNWLTSATIGDTNYDGIDNINEGMGSIDSIGSEYTDGMNAVQESTGTLPTSWLLLIGIAAAIPLLAGIVSRFLGG